VFGKPENRAVVRDLVKRLAAWGQKTGDAMTADLIVQWSAELGVSGKKNKKEQGEKTL